MPPQVPESPKLGKPDLERGTPRNEEYLGVHPQRSLTPGRQLWDLLTAALVHCPERCPS